MTEVFTDTPKHEGFVQLRRKLAKDFKSKEIPISLDGVALFTLLLLEANPHNHELLTNHATISESIGEQRWSKNKVNKVMLELKNARLIDYPDHQGKRGLFSIKISRTYIFSKTPVNNPMILPSKPQEILGAVPSQAEVTPSQQKWADQRKVLFKSLSNPNQLSVGRSTNNDNENETKSDNYIIEVKNPLGSSKPPKNQGTIPTGSYQPESRETARCLEIALDIGEPYMDFILSRLRLPGGLSNIETAYGRFRENKRQGKVIDNPGAYFNTILNNVFTERDKKASIDNGTQLNNEGT